MTDELREALPLIRRAIWRYMNYCYAMANMMAQRTSRDSKGNPYPISAVREALDEAKKAESLLEAIQSLDPAPEGEAETPKSTRDVLVDDLLATKQPKYSETPRTDAAAQRFDGTADCFVKGVWYVPAYKMAEIERELSQAKRELGGRSQPTPQAGEE